MQGYVILFRYADSKTIIIKSLGISKHNYIMYSPNSHYCPITVVDQISFGGRISLRFLHCVAIKDSTFLTSIFSLALFNSVIVLLSINTSLAISLAVRAGAVVEG